MCSSQCNDATPNASDNSAEMALEDASSQQDPHNIISRLMVPDILHVLFEILNLPDRISASRVCHAWREYLLNTPTLWNAFNAARVPPRALPVILKRSSGTNLRLKLPAFKRDAEVVACLMEYLEHCTSILMRLSVYNQAKDAAKITRALCRPAPQLREFTLFDDDRRILVPRGMGLFAGVTRLYRAKIYHNFRLMGSLDGFRSVKRLIYANPKMTTLADIQLITKHFPNLTGLGIDISDWKFEANPALPDLFPKYLDLPANLECLVLFDCDYAPKLLSRVHYQSLPKVHVLHSWRPPVEWCEASLEYLMDTPVPLTKLAYYACQRGHVSRSNILAWSSDGRLERAAVRIRGVVNPSYTFVTTLVLGETVYPVDYTLPDFPALVDLTLLMLKIIPKVGDYPDLYTLAAHDSVFLYPRDRSLVFSCPLLRTLCVCADKDFAIYVAPEVIREFIEWHLSYDAERLEMLSFRGVALLEHIPEEVGALLALADDFQVLKIVRPVPWEPHGQEDISKWHEWSSLTQPQPGYD